MEPGCITSTIIRIMTITIIISSSSSSIIIILRSEWAWAAGPRGGDYYYIDINGLSYIINECNLSYIVIISRP